MPEQKKVRFIAVITNSAELAPGEYTVFAGVPAASGRAEIRGERTGILSPEAALETEQDIIDGLNDLAEAAPEGIIDYQARMAGPTGIAIDDLLLMTNLPAKALESTIASMLNSQAILLVGSSGPQHGEG